MLFRRANKSINRAKLADELASMRVQPLIPASRIQSEFEYGIQARLSEIQHEVLVELYLTHYTNKQMRALRAFYNSDIGRSIVETDRRIAERFREELLARMKVADREMEAERSAHARDAPSRGWLRSNGDSNDEP